MKLSAYTLFVIMIFAACKEDGEIKQTPSLTELQPTKTSTKTNTFSLLEIESEDIIIANHRAVHLTIREPGENSEAIYQYGVCRSGISPCEIDKSKIRSTILPQVFIEGLSHQKHQIGIRILQEDQELPWNIISISPNSQNNPQIQELLAKKEELTQQIRAKAIQLSQAIHAIAIDSVPENYQEIILNFQQLNPHVFGEMISSPQFFREITQNLITDSLMDQTIDDEPIDKIGAQALLLSPSFVTALEESQSLGLTAASSIRTLRLELLNTRRQLSQNLLDTATSPAHRTLTRRKIQLVDASLRLGESQSKVNSLVSEFRRSRNLPREQTEEIKQRYELAKLELQADLSDHQEIQRKLSQDYPPSPTAGNPKETTTRVNSDISISEATAPNTRLLGGGASFYSQNKGKIKIAGGIAVTAVLAGVLAASIPLAEEQSLMEYLDDSYFEIKNLHNSVHQLDKKIVENLDKPESSL